MTDPITSAHPKTLAEWRRYIIDSLGGLAMNVELTETDLNHAVRQTLMLYNKFHPVWKWSPLGDVYGVSEVDFSAEPDGIRVVEVKFSQNVDLLHNHYSYPQYNYSYGFLNVRRSRMISKALVAQDRYRSFLGVQPAWKWDEENRKLLLYVEAAMQPVIASALLLYPNTIDNIPFHQEYDFLEGVVGHTKLILARKLGKYGAIPGAQGNITLDAETIRTQGKEAVNEFKRILDKSPRRKPPSPVFS